MVCQARAREVVFTAPATHFTESTPLGNGRLGMMVFGDPAEEVIILNENGMWSGSPQEADREDAYLALPRIKELLLEEKYVEAEALVNENFTCKGEGSGLGTGANVPYGCYQTLGKLHILQHYADAGGETSAYSDYVRVLDLENAVAKVSYTIGDTLYTREMWVSKPDEVAIISLKSDGPEKLNLDLWLDREERFEVVAGEDGRTLEMFGQLNDGYGSENGVKYASIVSAFSHDGTVHVAEIAEGLKLEIRNASEVIVRLTAATDIKTFAGGKLKMRNYRRCRIWLKPRD